MTFSLDNTTVEIPCPQCGKQLKEKIGRLKRDKHITCPACGRIAVDTNQLRDIKHAVDKQLAKIPKRLHIKLQRPSRQPRFQRVKRLLKAIGVRDNPDDGRSHAAS